MIGAAVWLLPPVPARPDAPALCRLPGALGVHGHTAPQAQSRGWQSPGNCGTLPPACTDFLDVAVALGTFTRDNKDRRLFGDTVEVARST